MYCGEPTHEDSKHPDKARTLHAAAGKQLPANYLDEFITKIRMTATELGKIKTLNLIRQDIRAAELNCRNSCYVKFKRGMAEQSRITEAMIRIQHLKILWL